MGKGGAVGTRLAEPTVVRAHLSRARSALHASRSRCCCRLHATCERMTDYLSVLDKSRDTPHFTMYPGSTFEDMLPGQFSDFSKYFDFLRSDKIVLFV